MTEITSHLAQQMIPFSVSAAASINHHALLLNHLRGGASALLATTAVTSLAKVGVGDGVVGSATLPSSESFLGMAMTPEGKAVVLMAISMALHYLGYSMARPVTVALFTSVDTGYSGA